MEAGSSDLLALEKKNNIYQAGTLLIIWSAIFFIIYLNIQFDNIYLHIGSIFFIGVLQHYLLVLLHESVHHSFLVNKFFHDYLSDIFIALPCLMFTKHYRNFHMKHHTYLQTDQDPENEMRKYPLWNFPKKNFFSLVKSYFSIVSEQSLPVRVKRIYGAYSDRRNELTYKIFSATYFFAILYLVYALGLLSVFFNYWLVPLFLILPFLLRTRNLAEHIAVQNKSKTNHTRDVEGSLPERFLLVPLNANYHLTHHLYPKVPWYNLRKLYKKLKSENQHEHYYYKTYFGKENSVIAEFYLE